MNKDEIKNFLLSKAKSAEIVYYTDLYIQFNIQRIDTKKCTQLFSLIEEISREESDEYLLASIIVLKNDNIPSSGYFDLQRLKNKYSYTNAKQLTIARKRQIHQTELNILFNMLSTKAGLDKKIDNISTEEQGIEAEQLRDQEDQEDKEEYPFDADKIRIEQKMLSLKYMIELMDQKLLNLTPGFQRNYVWNERKRKSLLIESLLLRIPIPAFYFYEDEDNVLSVIDGYQRLQTIKDFIGGNFALFGMEYLSTLKNCKFEDLEQKYKTRIYQTQLAINIIDSSTPINVKYDLFRRINTGGMPLNNQEIRNCIANENVRTLLNDMASSIEFLKATNWSIADIRMAAQELVLRFITFYGFYNPTTKELNKFTKKPDELLDEEIEILNKATDNKRDSILNTFKISMARCFLLFEDQCFRKVYLEDLEEEVANRRKNINKSLFTAFSVILAHQNISTEENNTKQATLSLAQHIENGGVQSMSMYMEEQDVQIAEKQNFYDDITYGTSSYTALNNCFRNCVEIIEESQK